jgi:penicillin-binding protein 1A
MRVIRFFLRLAALGALTACAVGFLGYLYFNHQLPKQLTAIEHYNPDVTSHVYAANGELIGEFYLQRRIVVPIEQIPDIVLKAFIAAEDQNFFKHTGVDYIGILRAFAKNFAAGRVVQGGSTITQQIARDFFLNRERTISRKIKEAILAYRIESELSKREILHLYLNQVYLGHGAYGVQAASQSYFGKDIRQINIAEAAMLAGLPQAPSRYSPYTNFNLARKRQFYVLERMLEDGYITPLEAEYARKYPVRIIPSVELNDQIAPYFVEHVRRYIMAKYGSDRVYTEGLNIQTTLDVWAQKAANEATEKGLKELDKRHGFRGAEGHLIGGQVEEFLQHQDTELTALKSGKVPKKGQPPPRLSVSQTYPGIIISVGNRIHAKIGRFKAVLDEKESAWAERVLTGHDEVITRSFRESLRPGDLVRLKILRSDGAKYDVALDQEPAVQGALVAIEPVTGYVKALVGGYDYSKSEFNRATQARRQPGSSFKPIIYATAIDVGLTEVSVFLDAPISFRLAGGRVWTPHNYKNQYTGPQTLRTALAKSINTVAIRLLDRVGVKNVVNYAKNFGIRSPLTPNLSLALGSSSVTPLELTQAYTAFVSGGRRVEPVFITTIRDRGGRLLEDNTWINGKKKNLTQTQVSSREIGVSVAEATERTDHDQVISPETAYIMVDLLKNVVRSGTGQKAKILGRPVGGKTGTTNRYTDAWFIGFSPDLVAGVWIGFDNRRSLGKDETGGKAALPLWIAFMDKALKGVPVREFDIPSGIVFASGSRVSAVASDSLFFTKTELIPFKRGAVPSGYGSVSLASAASTSAGDQDEEPYIDDPEATPAGTDEGIDHHDVDTNAVTPGAVNSDDQESLPPDDTSKSPPKRIFY